MSGVIEFQFNPGQTVWVIETVAQCSNANDSAIAVREGTVIQLRSTIQMTTVPFSGGSPLIYDNVTYDVRIGQLAGTFAFTGDDVFGTLADAITEYQARVGA